MKLLYFYIASFSEKISVCRSKQNKVVFLIKFALQFPLEKDKVNFCMNGYNQGKHGFKFKQS